MRRRLLACLALLVALAVAAPRAAVAREYAAVFSFGDSLSVSDTGNLCVDGIPDYLATARLPYGMTYFGYPTGRVSDGRVVIDFIAQELFRRSLFVVGEFGGSDYGSTIFSFRPLEEVHALVPHVVGAIARGVEELIAEGAVDLVVPGLLPTGCFPMFLSTFSDKPPAEPSTIASCSPIGRVTARRWRRTGRVAQERRGGDVTTGGATRRAGAGVRNQVSAAAGELGAVRDEVRERSGVNAWAVGSGAGAHRGRAGAEEPKAAGGELRTCSIGLCRLRRKKVPSDLQLGPTQPPHMPLCVKG